MLNVAPQKERIPDHLRAMAEQAARHQALGDGMIGTWSSQTARQKLVSEFVDLRTFGAPQSSIADHVRSYPQH